MGRAQHCTENGCCCRQPYKPTFPLWVVVCVSCVILWIAHAQYVRMCSLFSHRTFSSTSLCENECAPCSVIEHSLVLTATVRHLTAVPWSLSIQPVDVSENVLLYSHRTFSVCLSVASTICAQRDCRVLWYIERHLITGIIGLFPLFCFTRTNTVSSLVGASPR